MRKKTWWGIYLTDSETGERMLVAKVKSKGLAFITMKYLKETVYDKHRLTME